ncbi:glycolate oxidase iron-sulfur subunit [Ectothiorhodosinus mongolicus]|uniref:Glycolate oxidase iron-sulfur subunit n=1 Tax=Ectothiorhodosinus mongolicus TaxID=233100 RepID=A0A1R3VMB3_9GAMM|nr:glycolate oxidase subunit GlcF [Ectothiorhodosinus mongolicus]ULX57851.1 glycolate oxidase iron-sulfur subunit [Ectothiorhodosinus mongolicus]SIT65728.1 glycolate oxidase iron-sulfur subunit [Ectothiorhodosinus mongolicus]
MQTQLADFIRNTPAGEEAEQILRACVHCGFCNATCPTYQLLGNELDGPRGRIYLMKQALEGTTPTARTLSHLDRCLTCRNCETTCPSGVRYGRLVDIGREVVEQQVKRGFSDRLKRGLLRRFLLSPAFDASLALGRAFRPVLPSRWRRSIPQRRAAGVRPPVRHTYRVLMPEGCVQPGLSPEINAATARVLDRLGISIIDVPAVRCCGAIEQHLSAHDAALERVKANIDAWWPHIEAGARAVVMTASGCGAMVKDYGVLLAHDPAYAEKARQVSALAVDISELIAAQDLSVFRPTKKRVAFHPPCTLQHGQKLPGVVENILTQLGFELTPVADKHLCCGSAGTYSLLQPELAGQLKANKLKNLVAGEPEVIATANIGCQTHLASGSDLPVRHWICLLDEA